jgi:hypothetical protein
VKVLVTGGAGFIGSTFVRRIIEGSLGGVSSVTVLDKLTYAGTLTNLASLTRGDFEFIHGDIRDKFAALKPENKLLSMWHLGLPVLFSDTPSYSRLASEANQENACIKEGEWFAALKRFAQSDSGR